MLYPVRVCPLRAHDKARLVGIQYQLAKELAKQLGQPVGVVSGKKPAAATALPVALGCELSRGALARTRF